MPRLYIARGEIASYTGADDFLQIACAANKVIKIHEISIGQSSSETDDSSSITYSSRSVAKTGGTAINARPIDAGDAADSATILEQPDTGSPTDTVEDSWWWGALSGFDKIWTPETRKVLSGDDVVCFNFSSAITAVTLEYSITFEEIG